MDVREAPQSGRAPTDALIGDTAWLGNALTFSFPTAGQYTGYAAGEEPFDNFEAFNATQQAAVVAILTSISNFTNLTFTQSSAVDAGTAVLRFGMTDGTEVAHAYLPHPSDVGGDAWFRNTGAEFDSPVKGGYVWYTMVHEIGHALGREHPHEAAWTFTSYSSRLSDSANASSTSTPRYLTVLSSLVWPSRSWHARRLPVFL